jgi:hypothetical protein
MSDIVERLRRRTTEALIPCPDGLEGCAVAHIGRVPDSLCAEAAEEIERLRDFNAVIRNEWTNARLECHELTKQNMKLREALEGVISIADRDCPAFRAARAALSTAHKGDEQ